MPQLIGLALLGGALWLGYRALKKEMDNISLQRQRAEQEAEKAKRGSELVRGEDGVYRMPRDDDAS